jgi:hypothetical protein
MGPTPLRTLEKYFKSTLSKFSKGIETVFRKDWVVKTDADM